ncbi:MAG TPA: penicillin-binding transpeptidase domain-containing protein, partial [Ilumatobacteraceae bacterium]|nr:penicillin-binding transpeptidase domain-containing protein [Ilumatobacteraceae bacterium]
DTTTGAVRAMVGGQGLRTDVPAGEVNMALVPRQTGSAIKAFILAAAYEAGVQTNDLINGVRPCTVPDFVDGRQTTKTVNSGYGDIGPLNGPNTWSSSDCGFVRLSYAVGLHRVVDMTYKLGHSSYFYQGQAPEEHETFMPLPLTATGNNALSPMDMASGMQTILNQGLHHDPYYVEYIDRVDGTRFYSHVAAGTQVLDPGAANSTVLSLKGVVTRGTGARNLRNFPRVIAGKTGTQFENTNAWFYGGTPQITTAVWVGDPNGYTPMVNVPEFVAESGRRTIQGADYPARIWGAYMEAAVFNLPVADWPAPPPFTRPAARIYVPGEECLARLVEGTLPLQPGQTTTSTTTTTPTTLPPGQTTVPTTPTSPPKAVVQQVPSGTTVPANVFDPRAPVPSIDTKTYVYPCDRPPANVEVLPEDDD